MLGRYDTDGTTLRFTPAYPLVGGLTYVARLRPARVTTAARELSATLTVPRAVKASPTMVENIYPTGERVPANVLRMYIVFSAPMSIGQSASHLRLVDEDGQTVSGAFLQLEEELWDPTRRRLTVLFDPGRVKRGLRTNLERGAPLKSGHVTASSSMPAGSMAKARRWVRRSSADYGSATPTGARRILYVGASIRFAQEVGTRRRCVRRAARSRARGSVTDGGGRERWAHRRMVTVPDSAREWRFTPAHPWRPGSYRLRVSTDLEDVAGNSLRRVFDTDLRVDRSPADSEAGGSIELPIVSPTT